MNHIHANLHSEVLNLSFIQMYFAQSAADGFRKRCFQLYPIIIILFKKTICLLHVNCIWEKVKHAGEYEHIAYLYRHYVKIIILRML